MIGQKGIKTGSNEVPVRYEAIEKCLETLAKEAMELNASVHMPNRVRTGWRKMGTDRAHH